VALAKSGPVSESRKGHGQHSRTQIAAVTDHGQRPRSTEEFAPGREAHWVSRKTTDTFTLRSGRKLSASRVCSRDVPSYDQKHRQFLDFGVPVSPASR
jgi:hypothetical protein